MICTKGYKVVRGPWNSCISTALGGYSQLDTIFAGFALVPPPFFFCLPATVSWFLRRTARQKSHPPRPSKGGGVWGIHRVLYCVVGVSGPESSVLWCVNALCAFSTLTSRNLRLAPDLTCQRWLINLWEQFCFSYIFINCSCSLFTAVGKVKILLTTS